MEFLDSLIARIKRMLRTVPLETRPDIDDLAQRINPVVELSDLDLSDDGRQVLRQIIAQMQERSKASESRTIGSRNQLRDLILVGGSGRDRTMIAEVLASNVRHKLYRIDLSAVVSKYIGETEKNLSSLFDGAKKKNVILFFDEADALFANRAQVNDTPDRFAQVEVNFLLQRLEQFQGLAILATNRREDLNEAFTRRPCWLVELPLLSRESG